jgi:hypothetical protein
MVLNLPVSATPTMTISDGTISLTVTNASGILTASTSDGTWSTVISIGTTKPAAGSAASPVLDLSVSATCLRGSAPSNNLVVIMSDNDFGPMAGSVQATLSGNALSGTGQTVAYSSFYDLGNTVGATTTQLTTSGNLNGPAYASSQSAPLSVPRYSLTGKLTISAASTSSSYSIGAQVVVNTNVLKTPTNIIIIVGSPPFSTNGPNLKLSSDVPSCSQVDVSTDLSNWLLLTNLIVTNTPVPFIDPAARNYSRRYYRAKWPLQ